MQSLFIFSVLTSFSLNFNYSCYFKGLFIFSVLTSFSLNFNFSSQIKSVYFFSVLTSFFIVSISPEKNSCISFFQFSSLYPRFLYAHILIEFESRIGFEEFHRIGSFLFEFYHTTLFFRQPKLPQKFTSSRLGQLQHQIPRRHHQPRFRFRFRAKHQIQH